MFCLARIAVNLILGCVNTVQWSADGRLLVSGWAACSCVARLSIAGSDDARIVVWDACTGRIAHSVNTTHRGNIFCARPMPADDHVLVSCSGSGSVQCHVLRPDGGISVAEFRCHQDRTKKLAPEPNSSSVFYSSGEDGLVLCAAGKRKVHSLPQSAGPEAAARLCKGALCCAPAHLDRRRDQVH